MKKTTSMALALAMAATMAVPAVAATPVLISSNSYGSTITVNGTKLDTSKIPAAEKDMIPLRLVAESDYGSASWFPEENSSGFYFDGSNLKVNLTTGAISVDDETVSGTAVLTDGVTFVPATVLEEMDGYDVTVSGSTITITTPNNAPIAKAAYAIAEAAGVHTGGKTEISVLEDLYGFPEGSFEEAVSFMTMITTPDTIFVGKLSKDADRKAIEEAFEEYRQKQEDTFSWYLGQHLPKVQDARYEVEGDYVLFLIGEKADDGVAAFREFAAK